MELQDLLLPLIQNSPKLQHKLESVFGQPANHVLKSFNNFMNEIKSGPGIVNKGAEQQAIFSRIYQGGMAMGFSDWESELMAASIAGYTPMDVCISFRNKRGWKDTTVERVQMLMDTTAPRFIEKGRQTGLIPKETEIPEEGIPNCERSTIGGKAPWETEEVKDEVKGLPRG